MPTPTRGPIYHVLDWLNRLFCRMMYRVTPPEVPPLPASGPVLLVSDHSSFSDPMVLVATSHRPIIFLTAREIYERRFLRWFCRTVQYIPVSRGARDFGAVRAMLRALGKGEVVAMFPEGGIDEYRSEDGYPGVGYLALKTGASVVPASIAWNTLRPFSLVRSLLTPGKAVVTYGTPIVFNPVTRPKHEDIALATTTIMEVIRELKRLGA